MSGYHNKKQTFIKHDHSFLCPTVIQAGLKWCPIGVPKECTKRVNYLFTDTLWVFYNCPNSLSAALAKKLQSPDGSRFPWKLYSWHTSDRICFLNSLVGAVLYDLTKGSIFDTTDHYGVLGPLLRFTIPDLPIFFGPAFHKLSIGTHIVGLPFFKAQKSLVTVQNTLSLIFLEKRSIEGMFLRNFE